METERMGLKPGSKQWYRPTAETQMIVPLVAGNESNLKNLIKHRLSKMYLPLPVFG